MQLSVGQVIGDDAGHPLLLIGAAVLAGCVLLHGEQVQDVELVVELDVVLHTVLVEGLQNHVAGAVGGVAGPPHRGFAMIASVAAEAALVNLALGGAVERQPHLLQVQYGVDGLFGHHLGSVLVDQVVPALDGVEGVPLPVVLFDVGQGCAHAARAAPVWERVG